MAVRGTKPSDNPRRRNEPTHEWNLVADLPFVGGPTLGRRPGGGSWPNRTKAWWKVISSMPHCTLWSASDWEFALDTAQMAARFHEGSMTVGSELRYREKMLGTTADARRDLRIRYFDPLATEAPGVAEVAKIDDYRELYGRS